MALNDVYRVRIYTSLQQQLGVNVLHFMTTTETGTGATLQEIATAASADFQGAYRALLALDARYRGVGVQRVRPIPVTAEVFEANDAEDGLAAGEPLPKQICGVITWQTGLAGRSKRGRSYISFPAESNNDTDSSPTPGYLANLGTLRTSILSGVVAGAVGNQTTLSLIIFHRDDLSHDLVTASRINDKWGTQRRRGDYGKTNNFPV